MAITMNLETTNLLIFAHETPSARFYIFTLNYVSLNFLKQNSF